MPTVSVIMPVYNSADSVVASIKSVLNQTLNDLELIIIDDGSYDNSCQLIEEVNDSRIKLFRQPNQGVSSARNHGLHETTSEFIAFLDADDTWEPNFLKEMIVPLNQFPDVVLSYCGWQNVGLVGGRGEPFTPPDYECMTKSEMLLKGCPWPIHAALTRRMAIEKIGGFSENFTFAEDYLLWLQIAFTRPIFRIPKVLSFYHFHNNQATQNKFQVAINARRAKLEFLRQNPILIEKLGKELIIKVIEKELLRSGYEAYWCGDLVTARPLLKAVMKSGYGDMKDWSRMLPCFLPFHFHCWLIALIRNLRGDAIGM